MHMQNLNKTCFIRKNSSKNFSTTIQNAHVPIFLDLTIACLASLCLPQHNLTY